MTEATNSHQNFYISQVQKSPKLSYDKLFFRNNIAKV